MKQKRDMQSVIENVVMKELRSGDEEKAVRAGKEQFERMMKEISLEGKNKTMNKQTKKKETKKKSRTKKKVKKKKKKKKKEKDTGTPDNEDDARPVDDPWKKYRSVFGGTLSPDEGWTRLMESDSNEQHRLKTMKVKSCLVVDADSLRLENETIAERLAVREGKHLQTIKLRADAIEHLVHVNASNTELETLAFAPGPCWLRSLIVRRA